jgi:hypothetical protein
VKVVTGVRAAALSALIACVGASASGAQVAPDAQWRTSATEHFRVHFTPGLEPLARRAAAVAERAYRELAAELTRPRGPIDIVLSDDIDLSNGTATPFPTNRIVIYAAPPVEVSSLSFQDDWMDLVVTHELVHIFHLDRVRGPWRIAQSLFGRAPFLFPGAFAPSWMTEGLAVYYESLLTGAGRLAGTHHGMVARAAAVDHRIPRLDQWSVATPVFPGGNAAYVYGSLLMGHIGAMHGPQSIPRLVESAAVQLIPFWLDRPARSALGVRFGEVWRSWRDSLAAEAADASDDAPLQGWRVIASRDFVAGYPRWWDDSTVVYSGAAPRELLAARAVDLRGEKRTLGRVNSSTPNVRTPDGARVFAQHDLLDPYRFRSDLYAERAGRVTRLTRGARLLEPDVRDDGWIVATQLVPGGTRLVLLPPDGSRIVPIESAIPGALWRSPRFSPGGSHIAAIAQLRDGQSMLVIFDGYGDHARVGETTGARAVLSGPSWSPDGQWILLGSDAGGWPEIYLVDVADIAAWPRKVSSTATGLFHPEFSPDGRRIAAVQFTARGYEIGVAEIDPTTLPPATEPASGPEGRSRLRLELQPGADSTRRYSPWATLLPRYWFPVVVSGNAGTSIGAMSSGRDVIGRHEWAADAVFPLERGGSTWGATYRYAGFGVPWLELSAAQGWAAPRAVVSEEAVVGEFRRRTRDVTAAATFLRPRVRTASSLSIGAGLRVRDFETEPRELLDRLDPRVRSDSIVPRIFASASFSTTRRAVHAISPEEGFTVFGLVNQRWNRRWIGTGDAARAERVATRTLVGGATGYAPLALPGFSRHVLAARLSAGVADDRGSDVLEVGGVSGTPLAVLPGYTLGEGRRNFPVRGFASGALTGWKAVASSVEYRAPLVMPARGLGLVPFFLDRASLSLFGDAGAIWCDARTMFGCGAGDVGRERIWVASSGAELNVDAAVLSWDLPYRLRGGVAVPVAGREVGGAPRATAYFAAGLSF